MLQAVIFDIDGTLIDSVRAHAQAWHDALSHFGHDVAAARLMREIGKGADKILPDVVPNMDKSKHEEVDAWRSAHFKKHYLDGIEGIAQVPALFAALRDAGLRLALGSSAKGNELSAYKRIAGIENFELVQASSDDADNSKPDPDIFKAVVDKLQLPASTCVVVGDSPYDMQAARRAGVGAVAVLTGGFGDEELRQAGASQVYADARALLDAFEREGAHALGER